MKWVLLFVVIIMTTLIFIAQKSSEDDRQWREFSSQHHCYMMKASYGEPQVWQCEGFQVEHP